MTSKERAALKARASTEDTIVQIGKGGISPALVASVDAALAARELIKGRVLESSMLTAREACQALAEACDQDHVKAVLDVELNEGQMLQDVKLALNGSKPTDFFGHYGSEVPTVDEVKAKIKEMKEGI